MHLEDIGRNVDSSRRGGSADKKTGRSSMNRYDRTTRRKFCPSSACAFDHPMLGDRSTKEERQCLD